MPIRSKGMLITSMDIDPQFEDEFNLWYDREHLAERVAMNGFVEARRWVAHHAQPKYFATYCTQTFETLTSPQYQAGLANQTEWSKKNIARFQNMIRVVGRITDSRGQGRGAALAVIRTRPADQDTQHLRQKIHDALDPASLAGIISMHLIESDPAFSVSLTEPDKPNPGAADWFILVEGTRLDSVSDLIERRFVTLDLPIVTTGTYQLLWDLAKSDL